VRLFLGFCVVLLALLPIPAHAQEAGNETPERLVKVRILPESGMIEPGEEIWIGIEQSIKKDWHTYWKNPGDSGTQTRTDWTLPEGFMISDIYWPTPDKLPYGPLLNYGYSDNVILLQKLKAPDELPEGPLDLAVNVELLVCKEECIPEFGLHKITLNDPAAGNEDNSAYLERALDKLPEVVNWDVRYEEITGNNLSMLRLSFPKPQGDLGNFEFLPLDWGVVNNPASVTVYEDESGETLILEQPRGDRSLEALDSLKGILAAEDESGQRRGFAFTANPVGRLISAPANADAMPTHANKQPAGLGGIVKAMILALLGGIILNLMPCVFPVLSMKALSLAKTADKHPGAAKLEGIAYTLGVVLSFLAIAGVLIALKLAGAEIGWGFQLQNPVVITLLAYLLFLIGLNLSGYFEFGGGFSNIGGKLTQGRDGTINAFFTGILATLVATPCTAPFMGVAIGFALVQPPVIALIIFAMLGFGLALPYLLISFVPAVRHVLPKPGMWMNTFKEFLAFPMFASAIWLVWVLSQQAGPAGVLGTLMGMLAIVIALWLAHKAPPAGLKRLALRITAALLAIIALLGVPAQQSIMPTTQSTASVKAEKFGEAFTPEKLDFLLANSDEPVFVEMTASWCITCKVNHAVAINTNATKSLFSDMGVHYLIGDWTNRDSAITKYLESHGRNGVPLYVYYGARDTLEDKRPEPVVLPQLLTPGTIKGYVLGKH